MKTRVAAVQMCSGKNKSENIQQCEWVISEAAKMQAKLICLPENFAFLGDEESSACDHAEPLDGSTISHFLAVAKKLGVWLALGGFQEKIAGSNKIHNAHVVINGAGEIAAVYRKLHLFSVKLPDGSMYREDESVMPGTETVCVTTPFFTLGLSICYDVRFPLLYQALRTQGAEVLLVPAAFSSMTGPAHWEVLLRARAIETQSYVIAAAQYGKHNPQRTTHGCAMIIDPWGSVLAQCGIASHYALAEIDLSFSKKLREDMPIWQQRARSLL